MKFLNPWRKKVAAEKPFRRIYKGSVPFLRDTDSESFSYSKAAERRKSAAKRGANVQFNDVSVTDFDDAMQRPRSVRRHSIQPNAPKKHDTQPEKFVNNLIITSRYSVWNFLPKNLFEQFRRVVNFYFLVVSFIQALIDSPVHPVTAISPLVFVILVTAVKQGYEDWLRHKSDDQVNNRKVTVLHNGKATEIKSRDIQVGDVVMLESGEQIPTDLLLLGSSDEYLRCQINTANLDGETNLKVILGPCQIHTFFMLRYCPSGLPHFKSPNDLKNLHLIMECEQPNADLYDFTGSLLIPADKLLYDMHWTPTDSTADLTNEQNAEPNSLSEIYSDLRSGIIRQGMTDFLSIPLSMDNIVLRGTRLKNTDHIFGLVVYTGRDTRLAKNSQKSQSKFSTVEKAVNYYLIFFIIMLLFMVAFCSIMHYTVDWYPGSEGGDPWYAKDQGKDTFGSVINTVASFFVLFNYIIPISLYVTIELQKFWGSKFFVWDNEMVDDEGREPLCNTSDLNEELGQIDYLFSDKTGTLTQNVMQFRHCSIESVRYEYTEDGKLYLIDPGHHKPDTSKKPVSVFNTELILTFFKTLALCHSVQVVPKRRSSFDNGPPKSSFTDLRFFKKEKPSELLRRRESLVTPTLELSNGFQNRGFDSEAVEYQASSPDEKALLESCEELGIIYRGEKEDVMTIDVMGQPENYKRLMHLEFDADRKCMSVIVENQKGEKWLLTKGAESSIAPKCDHGPTHKTLKHVMDFALMGLRTLAVAVRKLTNEEYEEFNGELRAARRLIKNRQEKVREVYSKIEAHMTLIGATGVEDQLQDFVPETLQSFAAAGIRVWMLTGDKLETGVNVAVSCGLITASSKQYVVTKSSNGEEISRRLKEIQKEMDSSDNTCLVIDGDSLAMAFKECSDLLRDVSIKAFRVVCCRMAPLQKAQVVQMVKNSPGKPTCCAVGDGANDCAMILAAHVGIGILGKEGRQAARCADFALAKFGHLRRAILVHGHWYYVRLANLANYFFYKNVVFVIPQFCFSFFSNFSAQALLHGLFLMCFNIFFSSMPIFFYGLLEQPHSAETLLKNPHLYKKNQKNALMTVKKFMPWLISSLWHSVVVYFLPYFAWDNFHSIDNVMSFGTVVFTGIVIATNNKILIETKYLNWWFFGSLLFSYLSYFIITGIYSEVDLTGIGLDAGDYRHVYFSMMSSVCFWLLMLLIAVAAAVPDITFASVRHSWKHFKTFGKGQIRKKSIPVPKATLLFKVLRIPYNFKYNVKFLSTERQQRINRI